jgi:hypothetical protein
MHRVLAGQVYREADARGYVPLKVTYLRKVIPKRVERSLRRFLIKAGALECDQHYVIGAKARGYRIAPIYRQPARRVACADVRLARRILDIRRTLFRTDLRVPVHRHLYDWLQRLDIDPEAAHQIITSTPRLTEYGYIHHTAVEMIHSGHVEFSYCRQGRVHTLVTRLARELRPCLRIDGQPLVNIDVRCSQPLVLCALLVQPHHQHLPKHARQNITNSQDLGENGQRNGEGTLTPPRLPDSDVSRFVFLCENGQIYDHLRASAGLESLSRDELKVKFYSEIFFGRNCVVTPFTRAFGQEFSNVLSTIRQIKRHDYTRLACMMQRMEARIIIHDCCRRLMTDAPRVPVFTLHDALLAAPAHVDLVKQAMKSAFKRAGLCPTLKVERYSTSGEVIAA